MFYVQNSDGNYIEINTLMNSNENNIKSTLFHSSQTRKCLINGKQQNYVDSGDMVEVYKNNIYLNGRNNRTVKINAKLTDLFLLESVISIKNSLNFNKLFKIRKFYRNVNLWNGLKAATRLLVIRIYCCSP